MQEITAKTAVIEMVLSGSRVQERLSEALKPYRLSIAQFNVLRILRGRKGVPASLACINERMIHKMSNTTRLVDKLIEKGLSERIVCEANRRKVEITITDKGLKWLSELDGVIDDAEAELVANLSKEELAQLYFLLKKLKE